MIPAPFDYHRPRTVDDALGLLQKHGEDARILAGGHSLLPAMKFRLARPGVIVDIGRIGDLAYIRERNGQIALGALTTHGHIESSDLLRAACPLLPETAAHIGDVQVRNRGTIGGSLAHADPAADWPAAALALDAEIEIAGPGGRRTVRALDFFVDMLQTQIKPDEILLEVRVPRTPKSAAYAKFAQKASGFALCGVAAVVDRGKKRVSLGIVGVAGKAYRASAVEAALRGGDFTPDAVASAAQKAAEGVEPISDIHASAEFRAHLARVYARRAIETALARA